MAIHTRFGTPVSIIDQGDEGWVTICYEDGKTREVHVSELRATGGSREIDEAIDRLGAPHTTDPNHLDPRY